LRPARLLCLLCFSLASCAVGVDSGSDVPVTGDAGPRTDAAPLDGAATDAAASPENGGDTGASVDSGVAEAGMAETGSADTGTTAEAGPPADAAPEVGVSDSGCAGHGTTGVLVTFDLSSQSGSEATATATSSVTGIASGAAVARAAGLTAVSGSGSINASGWPSGSTANASDYFTLTVTPAAGCSVTLTTASLDVKASSTGPSTADVATSMDAFGTHTASFAGTATPKVTLTGVTSTGAIELRVYGYGASGTTGTFRIENTLTLSGSID
jgi:hypothetical protein